MPTARARRIAKLEAALAGRHAKPQTVPWLIEVRADETQAEAYRRFEADHRVIPRGHSVMVVPTGPRTDDERARAMLRFKSQQQRLVAEARRDRTVIENGTPVALRGPIFPAGAVQHSPRYRFENHWRPNNG